MYVSLALSMMYLITLLKLTFARSYFELDQLIYI